VHGCPGWFWHATAALAAPLAPGIINCRCAWLAGTSSTIPASTIIEAHPKTLIIATKPGAARRSGGGPRGAACPRTRAHGHTAYFCVDWALAVGTGRPSTFPYPSTSPHEVAMLTAVARRSALLNRAAVAPAQTTRALRTTVVAMATKL
jgi:hypothetical protein